MPEGVKLSYKSETLHKHVEYCMCYHSRIASGQRADALLGDWLSSFFFPFMKAQDDVVRLGAGHLLTYHMSMALTQKRPESVMDSHRWSSLQMVDERALKVYSCQIGQLDNQPGT